MKTIPLNDERTVTPGYVNETCRQALRSEVYDCRDATCMFILYEFLAQRGLGFQLNYRNYHKEYVFHIKIYTGNDKPRLFRGAHETPQVAAALALMQAIEDNE